ncbi:hypothetical protein CHS0354_018333 [Potamilus streckersoni]|uniref:Uncharacterized protein n=1 Tax=Potamilus streckersoni TaxID=2493646 RepID=A0AAE0RME1_9BIVA|nr:hypothetical protein CHS0354_018333 [Potamilus streckersoni]
MNQPVGTKRIFDPFCPHVEKKMEGMRRDLLLSYQDLTQEKGDFRMDILNKSPIITDADT